MAREGPSKWTTFRIRVPAAAAEELQSDAADLRNRCLLLSDDSPLSKCFSLVQFKFVFAAECLSYTIGSR